MKAGKRLFVARFFYEGNSFGPLLADRAAFSRMQWAKGPEAVALASGIDTELAALPEFLERHPQWQLVVSRCAVALPAGPIEDSVFEEFLAEVLRDLDKTLAESGLDGIYLSLHGAAMTQSRPSPELDLLKAVRARCPRVPLAATFDMHANLPPQLAQLLTVACGYRTHPHLDKQDAARRALEHLHVCVEHDRATRSTLVNTGLLLPSINMRTSDGPMRALQEAAARAERQSGVLAASVFGGFPYADASHAGASALVFTSARDDANGALSRRVAGHLATLLRAAGNDFFVRLPSPEQGIAQALACPTPGPIAVTDAADNPLSGGGCDTPGLLPALLAAAPTVPCVFASFADPAVVAAAKQTGPGQPFEAMLGARRSTAFGHPVMVRVVPQLFTNGKYRPEYPLFHGGGDADCGRSVLLAVDGRPNIRIIVTEHVDSAIDPAFYTLHGIALERERLILVKAKNHFRAGAGKMCSHIIDVDAPGPACLDFSQLPYRHRRAVASHRA